MRIRKHVKGCCCVHIDNTQWLLQVLYNFVLSELKGETAEVVQHNFLNEKDLENPLKLSSIVEAGLKISHNFSVFIILERGYI